MGKADPSLLLSWSSILTWGAMILLLISLVVMILAVRRPRLFWPMLIIAGILGCGPRIAGYPLLDEILSGSVVLGTLLRISLLRSKHLAGTDITSSHSLIFNLWIGFMIMESIVGVIYNEDLRIIKWILFYCMLGIIAAIIRYRGREFPFPSVRQTSSIIVITTMALYIVYLGQGMYFENLLGSHGRFLSQDTFWAGSAYAVFPSLVAAPASFILLDESSPNLRRLAWASLALQAVTGFYYDSRIAILVILGCFLVSLYKIKVRTVIVFPLIFTLIFVIYMPEPEKDVVEFSESIFEASQALWSPGKSDVNRNLQLRAGLLRSTDNLKTFLIGDGVYSHRFTVIPHIQELYREYLPPQDFLLAGTRDDTGELTIFRTVGFTALLVDTGVIGMLLFSMNFLFVGLKITKRKSPNLHLFLVVIFMAWTWLLSNNITDITLLYLLIMPNGLIKQWSQNSIEVARQNRTTGYV